MYIHPRANWEFLAVVEGQCGAVLHGDDPREMHARRLWVFPPDTEHGWSGKKTRPSKVAIFHFGAAPALLERVVRKHGHVSVPLTAAQARWISRLPAELEPHYRRRSELSHLVFESALLDLTLLVLAHFPSEGAEAKSDFALQKTEAAMAWYGEHLPEQPKLERVAQAVNLSVRHLRRLFWDTRNESPQAAFAKLRIRRAMEVLAGSDMKQDEVAALCGFSSGSDFCRVFKNQMKISPHAWRKRLLKACGAPGRKRPSAAAEPN